MENVRLQFESIHIVDTHACSRAHIEADHPVHRRHPRHQKRTQPDQNQEALPLDFSN